MSRTKIVATIGPSSSDPDTIRRMLKAGMTVARINFSHGDHATHIKTVETLRRIAAEEKKVLAILGDLQGPKIRLGYIGAAGMQLSMGDEILLTPFRGQPAMIHLPHPELIETVALDARLVIGDGEVEFKVLEKTANTLRCVVTVPGLLESRKGINAPGTDMGISAITEKDREDLRLICELDLDFVALSFVRDANDIVELRDLMKPYARIIPIIAKIEKNEAIEHLEEIVSIADGVMVARGDLGIEMNPARVPLLQKRIIRLCNTVGKPVITATQMLQSMVEHPQPTRAEASDVANAILDGTDAVMLSGETAAGKHPVKSVQMMRKISAIIEEEFPYDQWRDKREEKQHEAAQVTEAISSAACSVAEQVGARMIVCTTTSGFTARQIARYRPRTAIVAVSPEAHTQRRLALTWGTVCLLSRTFTDTNDIFGDAIKIVAQAYSLEAECRLVATAGLPFGLSGHTNLIQVHEVS